MSRLIKDLGVHRTTTMGELAWKFRKRLALVLLICLLLFYVSIDSYITFHIIVELFTVGVAVGLFIIVLQTYPFTGNNFMLFLGIGYFWVGGLDFAHMLLYKGMPTSHDHGNMATQLWVSTRMLEALILLAAPYFISRTVFLKRTFLLFGLGAGTLYITITHGLFPDAFVDGEGLTLFKVMMEYQIILILLLAMFHLRSKRQLIDDHILHFTMLAILATIVAELAFTIYQDLYGVFNRVGHLFKLISFWLLFIAMIDTMLSRPFQCLSRALSSFDAIPMATLLVGGKGRIINANRAAHQERGRLRGELAGRDIHDEFHPSDLERENCPLCSAQRTETELLGKELMNGEQWIEYSITPLINSSYGKATILVCKNITEQKRLQESLQRSNEALDHYAKSIARELEKSMAAMHEHAKILAEHLEQRHDLEDQGHLYNMLKNIGEQQELLRDLMVFSQVGQKRCQKHHVNCNSVIKDVMKVLTNNLSEHKAVLDIGPLPMVWADPQEVHHLFYHLIDSTLEAMEGYAPEFRLSAVIEMGESQRMSRFLFHERNSERDKKCQNRLMELFLALQRDESGGGGAGVGLALCKRIVEQQGGEIITDSDLERGVTLIFTLPIKEGGMMEA
uniref:histidine kinase n=1 Tax=Magnetococcus massalia (strain MO-1) TaxID=451514 RepID=A0A1S7LCY3_MAGMO|nr:Putative histidine kinase with PAS fold domain [Candidatus Magnetococcus massalia]